MELTQECMTWTRRHRSWLTPCNPDFNLSLIVNLTAAKMEQPSVTLDPYSRAAGGIAIIFKSPPDSAPSKANPVACPQEFRSCPQPDCAFKTLYDSIYTRHLKTHEKHAVQQVKPQSATLPSVFKLPDGQFGCSACDYTSKSKHYARTHLVGHRDEKPFRCSLCSYRSKWKGNLRAHERRVHNGRARTGSSLPPELPPHKSHVKQFVAPTPPPPLELPLDLPDVTGYGYREKAPCPHCGLNVLARFLRHHIVATHAGLKSYGSSLCSYRARWPADVKTNEKNAKGTGKKTGGQIDPQQDENRFPQLVILTPTSSSPNPIKPAPVEAARKLPPEQPPAAALPGQQFTPTVPTSAIPSDCIFACMLCNFVGTTLESATAHAVTHNIPGTLLENN